MTNKVLVVGAGFAGLIAARELRAAGSEVEIFEARDRIGGRAWTEQRMGYTLELGATWVHWMQPFVWSEIVRYGQTIYPSPEYERAYWLGGGVLHEGAEDDLDATLQRPQAKIFEGSAEFFPYPHDPLYVLSPDYAGPADVPGRFRAADQGSVLDALRDGTFSQEEIDVCDAYWAAGYNGDPATASPLMAKHWAALSDHRLSLLDEQTLKFKLTDGMRGLYEAIAADLRCPIHLSTPVSRVEHGQDGARITLEDGSVREADAVIVTVPIGALGQVEFAPELPRPMRRVVDERTNSTGFKIWIKIEGHHSFIATAPGQSPIAMTKSEYFLDDGTTILVGFGPDHTKINLQDTAQVQQILRQWRPDLTVVDCDGHDWCADPWSGETWATVKSGQFTDGWHHFHNTDSRLYFAGADFAKGWNGVVVDGAIEMGITAARRVLRELG
ncbi:MAG: FAD-dependent oxidoreductase [Intrasporangium sp.]|uniref:NAD(P)/FAD-dependent oxidoreductase n=1 Tax=Intrasporangium sp. TaxID=1925024 RepID=UPI0026482FB9|nr:NAD(P)/FAD-dependent oxidoreductase [Intrasporangium sp.]MDN5795611.1 FAD-dependent oxidoreductase [Intrasporangium sp.]